MLSKQIRTRLPISNSLGKLPIKKNSILIACVSSYFVGLVLGAANISYFQNKGGYFELFIEKYLSVHLTNSIWDIWQSDFLSSLFLFSILLFSALSCVGTPIAIFVPAIRGIFTGLLTACLYLEGGSRGVLLNGLTFLIPNAGIAIVMVLFSCDCAKCSLSMLKNTTLQVPAISKGKVRSLFWRFTMSSFAMLVLCFFQAILLAIFGPLFG